MQPDRPGGAGSDGAAGADDSTATAKPMQAGVSSWLVRLTLGTGWWASLLAPIAGLPVFWWMPFKPAVTVYAMIVGLGMALHSVVEEARMRREIREIARRQVHEYDAR
jgi:hypothetical protein